MMVGHITGVLVQFNLLIFFLASSGLANDKWIVQVNIKFSLSKTGRNPLLPGWSTEWLMYPVEHCRMIMVRVYLIR